MKRNKNKRGVGLAGTFGVQTTPPTILNPNPQLSKAEELKNIRDEEARVAAAADAKRLASDPVHILITEQSKAVARILEANKTFWQQSIDKIIAAGDCESAKCPTFQVPALRDSFTFEDARRAFDIGYASIVKSGYELADAGGSKLVKFGMAQGRLQGCDMSNGPAWETAFNFLKDDLSAFDDSDFAKKPRPVVVPHITPKPTFADVERINASAGSDSEREARRLTTTLMTAEIQPVADRWFEHLMRDYNFSLTDFQLKWVLDWFKRTGANPMIHESWNRARRAAVDDKIFPSHMKTRDEMLCEDIERGAALSTLGFHERQELFTDIKRMREPE